MTEREPTDPPLRPWLRVVRGDPSEDELAALVAVVAAQQARASRQAASVAPARRSSWGQPAAAFRQPLRHGPDAWRRSALPG